MLNPRNLRLPFWLFNFEETIDAFFGGRPGVDEEVEILSEVIPLAKAAYLQYRNNSADRLLSKRRDPKDAGFTADTPVPYRIEDLIALLDERMGKLENRSRATVYHKLIGRIQTFRNHPRYAFMFENANIGGDTMAEIIGTLFRLPPDGKPMTIMQLAGFPAEVIDSVVSVLCRMAFDFGLWSDGVAPLLFVCEEAHRYAPADKKIGFGPTRRALSRIAKEGRKYGVFLGLVTQRPAEIDPTIISQCSTLFVMRLSNDRDQELIRSAVSDAAENLLSFIPSLGTREVFCFGAGVALPTRMRFGELPPASAAEQRGVRLDALGCRHRHEQGSAVVGDRALAQRQHEPSHERGRRRLHLAARRAEPAAADAAGDPAAGLSAAAAAAIARAAAPQPSALRSSLLKKPLDASLGTNPPNMPRFIGRRLSSPRRRGRACAVDSCGVSSHARALDCPRDAIARDARLADEASLYFTPTTSISADMPPWPAAFVSLGLVFADVERREVAERRLQKLARVEVLQRRRSAGLVLELLGRVALEQQQAARLQGALDAGEDLRAFGRRGELEEDCRRRRRRPPPDSVQLMTSACSVRIVTPRAAASLRAFACAFGEKSSDSTSRPCSARKTPLRPSPSAMASALAPCAAAAPAR